MSLSSIRNFDHVILLCDDMARMRDFYGRVLRLPCEDEVGADARWIRFRLGSGFLTLRPRGRWRSWQDGPRSAGSAALQLAFRVAPNEVAVCHEQLLAQGVTIIEPPADQPFGHRTLFFRDPEDNVIEIYAEL